jgi:hypothetical protein
MNAPRRRIISALPVTKRARPLSPSLGDLFSLLAHLPALFQALRSIASSHQNRNAREWPGVDQAFELAKDSYDALCQRLDAADARLQTLLTYSASFTLAVPVIVGAINKNATFTSYWFYAAMFLFVVIVIVGTVGLAYGTLRLISPKILYEEWLGYSEWEFKKNFVFWAGVHFEQNRGLVNKKGWTAILLTMLFLGESALLVVWAGRQL